MTERKRWPNHAEDARIEAIATARNGIQTAKKVARGQVDTLSGLTEVVDQFHRIIENLMMVGPKSEMPMRAA